MRIARIIEEGLVDFRYGMGMSDVQHERHTAFQVGGGDVPDRGQGQRQAEEMGIGNY